MNCGIIVEILFFFKAIILGIQNILEVLNEDMGIRRKKSIFLCYNISVSSFISNDTIHFVIA